MVFTCSQDNKVTRLPIFAGVVALLALIIAQGIGFDDGFIPYLDKSVPFIGTDVIQVNGADGNGIVIAVIDTGIDYNHPDLLGWGSDGKVIGGYNFINEGKLPIDTNGHGTQVAGVIAADGEMTGVAPKAKILAYKVSEDGEGVSSELIIRAIDRAIEDGADIINISLGINKTNTKIDRAVNKALDQDIFVVTAAGNDGPGASTIGSPGRNYGAVTVGATYNNLTSSMVATLDIDQRQYIVIPMVGSPKLDEPIRSEIVFAGYASVDELRNIDAKNKILLVERGNTGEELLYFSTKERNSADAGASALIVYNNEPGIFLGELIHQFVDEDYRPRIPVVSIDRKDGLEIKEGLGMFEEVALHLFYNPDSVVQFSSRGPVSPFYIKPDIVAPGAYINTTQNNAGYNFTSGTSYAAPHVSGAAALLMQKNPDINHHEIKSLLLTTAEPVSDAYGNWPSANASGAGRLNIAKAFEAGLIIQPPSFVVNLSSFEPTTQKEIKLKLLEGTLDEITVSIDGPEFIEFTDILKEDTLRIKMDASGDHYGSYEAKINISHDGIDYVVPVLIHYTEAMVSTSLQDYSLIFEIDHPEEWSFAKISVTNNRDVKTQTITATPKNPTSLDIYKNAEYWIEAEIRVDGKSHNAFSTINVDLLPEYVESDLGLIDIPEKQIGIISGIVLVVGMFWLIIKRI